MSCDPYQTRLRSGPSRPQSGIVSPEIERLMNEVRVARTALAKALEAEVNAGHMTASQAEELFRGGS